MLDEGVYDFDVTLVDSQVQRGCLYIVHGVDVGPELEEEVYDFDVTLVDSQVEEAVPTSVVGCAR